MVHSFLSPCDGEDSGRWGAFAKIGTQLHIPKGRIIYLQGQSPQYLYYLQSGQVKSFLVSDRGEERILSVYHAGSIFGEASFFDAQPRMSSAAALANCCISAINRDQALTLFEQQPQLAVEMLRYLSQTVRLLSEQVDHITFLQADQRILRVLLSLPSQNDVIRTTQDHLASAVGASRITVCRCLNRLSAQGLIQTGYRAITLCDRAALQKLAQIEE